MMSRRLRLAIPLIALLVAGCRSPAADAQLIEQMRQLGDELNGDRQEAAAMHEQLDSLRLIVARQDTIIRQLASMANLQIPTR